MVLQQGRERLDLQLLLRIFHFAISGTNQTFIRVSPWSELRLPLTHHDHPLAADFLLFADIYIKALLIVFHVFILANAPQSLFPFKFVVCSLPIICRGGKGWGTTPLEILT